MAYNNNIYGNAAFAGFFAGMLEGRSFRSATQAHYVPLRTTALAMAVAVDALIAFDALVTTAAAITMLNPANVIQAAIAGTVIVPGDGGAAIKAAVVAATTGNVIPANEMFRTLILYNLCRGSVTGRYDVTITPTVQAAAIVAAWTVAVAGFVIP